MKLSPIIQLWMTQNYGSVTEQVNHVWIGDKVDESRVFLAQVTQLVKEWRGQGRVVHTVEDVFGTEGELDDAEGGGGNGR